MLNSDLLLLEGVVGAPVVKVMADTANNQRQTFMAGQQVSQIALL